jgi:UDP-N-acetylglucosamine--N-acetylmuramyl-(pentapeptide) pyrophosphoryl-undecaprenol N-acetylglucosamine transferase
VGEDRLRVVGVPLRRNLVSEFREPQRRGSNGAAHLLIFGGSQGARQINELLIEAAPRLDPARIEIVHQTGEADRERVEAAYAATALQAEVIAFERDMPSRYRWADLVLCRAGAISVAELALAGRASLLVPLAHVGGGEQLANARELEKVGAARVLDSRALSAEGLLRELESLLGDPARLRRMGESASKLARPDASDRIIEECRSLLAAKSDGGESR